MCVASEAPRLCRERANFTLRMLAVLPCAGRAAGAGARLGCRAGGAQAGGGSAPSTGSCRSCGEAGGGAGAAGPDCE